MTNADSSIAARETEAAEKWDIEIKPNPSWFNIPFKEIWSYRDLLRMFVRRDFVAVYKQTVLGPLWFVLQPVLTTVIFMFVFGRVAHIPTDGIPSALFYMAGLTLWTFFSTCFTKGGATFTLNASLFGKVYFPRLISPLGTLLINLLNFGIQFGVFLVMLVWYVVMGKITLHFNAFTLMLPVILFLTGALGLGLGLIVSSLTTRFRDLIYVATFAIQLLMYASPVIYSLKFLKDGSFSKQVIVLNPVSYLLESFRIGIFDVGMVNWGYFAYSSICSLAILFVGVIMFNKSEKTFMDVI
ncbi:MAG: ABC transporter permease [Bacteroidota bacterium]